MRLLPSKIQLDVLKRHIGPFIFCFFTVMFLLLMQFLILYIDRLIGKGLPFGVIIELILTNLAYMVVLAAPMAVLVSSLMAFGKFTELNELTALRAAGINPIHTINPVLVAAGILSLFLIWFSNDVLPDANQRARSLFLDIRTKKPGFDLEENEFYDGIKGYTFLVKNMPSDSDSLYDVTLFQDATGNRKSAIIKANKGYLKSKSEEMLTLYLYNGMVSRNLHRIKEGRSMEIVEQTEFDRYRLSFDLSEMAFSRSDPNDHSRNDRTMDVQAMKAVADTLREEISREKQKVFDQYVLYENIPEDVVSRNKFNIPQTDSVTDPTYQSNFAMMNLASRGNEQQQMYRASLTELRSYRSSYDNLNVNANWRNKRINQYWVEIYKKFSIPLACIIFVMIGAPIGMYTQKGNIGYAALIATGFLVFFWISIIQGEKLADRLFISPFTGMWFSDILLAVVGAVMILQISTSFRISDLWKRSND